MKRVSLDLSDPLFARMMELELSGYPYRAKIGEWETADLLICDADRVLQHTGESVKNIIGISDSDMPLPREIATRCRLILHRPFSMKRFRMELDHLLAENTSESTPALRTSLVGNMLYQGEKEASLTPFEKKSFCLLQSRMGEIVSVKELSDQDSPDVVRVHLSHLRKKLEAFHLRIEAKRGLGYRMTADGPMEWNMEGEKS